MEENLALSAAQIQYLKIGPKVGTLQSTTRKLQESLNRFDIEGTDSSNNLASIPKLSYGNFEGTVRNFGVLLHRNFVGTTTLHQAQKFGKIAFSIDRVMQSEKDKQGDLRKTGQKKTFIDPRVALKAIYEYKGHKLLVTLKSFSIESLQTHRIIETLPIAYLKLITTHVNSSKIVKVLEGAMRSEGTNMVVIDYDKMESKVDSMHNAEQRYPNEEYIFQRSGQQFSIILPSIEIYHSESDYRVSYNIDNKDILNILECDFDNVDTIIEKYTDFETFEKHLNQHSNEGTPRIEQKGSEKTVGRDSSRREDQK